MEFWDAYNKELKKIKGMTLVRGEAIPDGVYHLVSEVIVKHIDGDYLLMQRDSRKHFGGMWEATAGGSALQGEDAISCAIRELHEETGIISNEISMVGQVINDDNHTIYVEFLCFTDCRKDSVSLQKGETSAFRWVTKDELVSMKKEELVTKRMQRFINELKPSDMTIHRTENIELTVLCLVQDGDKILLQNRVKNDWQGYTLPGGHVEPGESFVDAVVREMKEETGLDIINPRLAGIKQFPIENGRYVVLLFKATEFAGTLISSEEGQMEWIEYSELSTVKTVDDFDDLLKVMNTPELTEFQYLVSGDEWTVAIR